MSESTTRDLVMHVTDAAAVRVANRSAVRGAGRIHLLKPCHDPPEPLSDQNVYVPLCGSKTAEWCKRMVEGPTSENLRESRIRTSGFFRENETHTSRYNLSKENYRFSGVCDRCLDIVRSHNGET